MKTPVLFLYCTLICPLVYSNLLKDSDNVSFNGEADLDLSTESLFMQFQNHQNYHFKHSKCSQLIQSVTITNTASALLYFYKIALSKTEKKIVTVVQLAENGLVIYQIQQTQFNGTKQSLCKTKCLILSYIKKLRL